MDANEKLANRVREALTQIPKVEERRMFRGITFMVDGKMCVSVNAEGLMCRIDPQLHDALLEKAGVRTVMMGGRAYRGFVYVATDAVKSAQALDTWMGLVLDFNKRAKASGKKKGKSPAKAG